MSLLGIIVLILIIAMIFGGFPNGPVARNYGYYPSGGMGLILVIILIVWLVGRL